VTAFDALSALAGLASEHCGLPVEVRRFQEVDWEGRFDGIWACASLLHVSMAELPEVLRRLGRVLKPDGVLQPAGLEAWERCADEWRLAVRCEGRQIGVEALVLADVSGRAGTPGRRRRRTGPKALALAPCMAIGKGTGYRGFRG
jgi:hypothetical protein